jgi:anti-sigma B factor antagonist
VPYVREDTPAAVVLRCRGELTSLDEMPLQRLVDELLAEGRPYLLADLADVDFVDSAGLGGLLWGMKRLRKAGGDLRLAGARAEVRRLFALTTLDRHFLLYDDADEGLSSFAESR